MGSAKNFVLARETLSVTAKEPVTDVESSLPQEEGTKASLGACVHDAARAGWWRVSARIAPCDIGCRRSCSAPR